MQKTGFEKNMELEKLLKKINNLLEPVEKEQLILGKDYSIPAILKIGAPRSGSTFFTQWICSTGIFSFPTNFLSRFYAAPYIGALIYEMLVNPKYNYKDEFFDISLDHGFKSDVGKTKGFNANHEFMYLWRHNFNIPEIPVDNETFMRGADFDSFNSELSLLHKVFGKPFIVKAHVVNWYLKSLSANINNAIYVHIPRNPVSTIRSLMKAALKTKGRLDVWASWKPKEYSILKEMDVYRRFAGQIYFIEKTILQDRKYLGARYLMFSYEDLCNNPEEIYYKVINKVNQFSKIKIEEPYNGKNRFNISNPKTEFDDKQIELAYQYFIDNFGPLSF